jgi:hypothetical protein
MTKSFFSIQSGFAGMTQVTVVLQTQLDNFICTRYCITKTVHTLGFKLMQKLSLAQSRGEQSVRPPSEWIPPCQGFRFQGAGGGGYAGDEGVGGGEGVLVGKKSARGRRVSLKVEEDAAVARSG